MAKTLKNVALSYPEALEAVRELSENATLRPAPRRLVFQEAPERVELKPRCGLVALADEWEEAEQAKYRLPRANIPYPTGVLN